MVSDIKKSLEMDLDMNTVLSAISYEMYNVQNGILRKNKLNNSDVEIFLKKADCYMQSFEKDEIFDVYLTNNGDIHVSCRYISFRSYERHTEDWSVNIPDNIVEAYEKHRKEIFDFKYDEAEVSKKVYDDLLKDYMENLLSEKIKEYKDMLLKQIDEKKRISDLKKKKQEENERKLYETLKVRFEGGMK